MSELVSPVGHSGMGDRSALSFRRDGEDFSQMLLEAGAKIVELDGTDAGVAHGYGSHDLPVPVSEDESSRIYGFGQFSSLKLSYVSTAYQEAEVAVVSAPLSSQQQLALLENGAFSPAFGQDNTDAIFSVTFSVGGRGVVALAEVMAFETAELSRTAVGGGMRMPIVARKMAVVSTSDGLSLVIRDYYSDLSASDMEDIVARCRSQGIEPDVVILNGKKLDIGNLRERRHHGR